MQNMKKRNIRQMSRVFANSRGDRSSIPGRVLPKIIKMVLDAIFLYTQHYKIRIKDLQSREWNSALTNTIV